MLHFLDELAPNKVVDCDICIIGSGFAGLSLAQRLSQKKNLKVIVAEGSSNWYGTISARRHPPNPPEQKLYQGSMSGWIHNSDSKYLLNSRLRTLGGTSSLWSGWAVTLEDADFTRHNSHIWPITAKEIHAYYSSAKQFLGLQDGDHDKPEQWIADCPYEALETFPTKSSPLRTRILQLNPIRLQHHYIDLFSQSIDLYRNAHLVELGFSNKTVQEARFQSYAAGKNSCGIKVKASCFILAQGALETTRQMLLTRCSNRWLGRNFLEHPYVWQAAHFSHRTMPKPMKRLYDASLPVFRRDGSGFVGMLVPKDPFIATQKIGSFRMLLHLPQNKRGWLNLSFEQLPHDRPCISLSKNKDLFGNPLLHLETHWDAVDDKTLETAIQTTCEYLKSIECISSLQIPKPKVIPGFHPAGTTRMGMNTSEGVVDKNCQVFGCHNLFIASSSVFPSCGYANPTLTIVALAQRLADHLLNEHFL